MVAPGHRHCTMAHVPPSICIRAVFLQRAELPTEDLVNTGSALLRTPA